MLSRKVKVAAPAVAVAGVFAGSAQASVIDYEINVWAIDHSNSPALASGGTLNAWDGHDRERPQHATAARATTIDLADAARRGGHAFYAQVVPTLDKRVRQPYRTVVALAKAIA